MLDFDPTLLAIVLQFVAYFVVTSALVVWAGISRVPIALRCAVLLGWLALWIPAQVDDLGWFTLVEVVTVLGVCTAVHWSPREIQMPRRAGDFSLRNCSSRCSWLAC
jgi:hypothetical protein